LTKISVKINSVDKKKIKLVALQETMNVDCNIIAIPVWSPEWFFYALSLRFLGLFGVICS